ncbi:MAG TPA: hypothetical protein VD927_07945 [Chryseosolibacter sp.]|nr:hypothetical protein [Chryseosolibacter sp.]
MFRSFQFVFLAIAMVLLSKSGNAQALVVSSSKKTFYLNGEKIKTGDTLDLRRPVIIKQKGTLQYAFPNKWSSHTNKPDTYRLDTMMASIMSTKEYILHDSIFNILKSRNLHDCHFNYHFTCKTTPGGHACDFADDIKIENDQVIRTNADSVPVSWKFPVAYGGNYFMVISDMFDNYLALTVTSDTKIDLDLRPHKKQPLILYYIISEECRESSGHAIKMN